MKNFILLIILISFISISQAQNGTRLIGFDAKTIGRGATTIGFFDNPSLMMSNPAGISFMKASELDADFSIMLPSLHFTNSINDANGNKNYYPLPSAGYVHKPRNGKFTWGIGVFTQGGMGSDFEMNNSLFRDLNGNYIKQDYYSKFAVMQGGPSVSYKFSDNFALGLTAHLVYSQMEFKMPYSLSPSMLQGVVNPQTGMTFGQLFSAPQSQGGLGYNEVTAAADMNNLKAFGFAGKIGLAYKVDENFALGLSYTLPSKLTYKSGKANMDMTAQMNDAFGIVVQGFMTHYPGITQQQAQDSAMNSFSQMGIDLSKGAVASYDLENKMTLPQSVGFGISYFPQQRFRLAADFEWINWANAFDKMQLTMNNGANPNINRMMGNDGSFTLDFPMHWKNSYVVHVGSEFDITKLLTVRAGYSYGTNPVPESTLFPVFPAIVENHVTFGVSYQVSKPIGVNFGWEMALKKNQSVTQTSLIANEYNNSTSSLSTMLFHLSLSWRF